MIEDTKAEYILPSFSDAMHEAPGDTGRTFDLRYLSSRIKAKCVNGKSLLKCFYFNSDEENEKLDKGAKCGNNEPISFSVDNRFSFS